LLTRALLSGAWKRFRVCSDGSSGGVRADELIDARGGTTFDAGRVCCCGGRGGAMREGVAVAEGRDGGGICVCAGV